MPAKRKSAFSAALQEAQQQTVSLQDDDIVKELHSDTVPESHSGTVQTSNGITVSPLDSPIALRDQRDIVQPFRSDIVQGEQYTEFSPPHSDTVKPSKDQFSRKVSFYLTPGQEKKLDDLADDYRRHHDGKRINRNDVVRYLIDQCTLETLESLG